MATALLTGTQDHWDPTEPQSESRFRLSSISLLLVPFWAVVVVQLLPGQVRFLVMPLSLKLLARLRRPTPGR